VYAYGQNSIKLRGNSSRNYGKNKIESYYQGGTSTYGIFVTGGTPDLGQISPTSARGKNDFIYNSKYIVKNSTASEVIAEKNYWGGTPQSSWFSGSVGYDPYYSSSQGGGSSLEKSGVLDGDRQLLAAANELQDSKDFQSASVTYKQLIDEYPDSRYAGIALAWAMAAHKENSDLELQRDYLQKMTGHTNQRVRDKAWLWRQSLESWGGNMQASEEIVKTISMDDAIGVEIRLNWANDLYNVYNDEETAQIVFDELLAAKPDDDAVLSTIEAIKKTARTHDSTENLPKSLSEKTGQVVMDFNLHSYPNPFSARDGSSFGGTPSTTIQFHLAESDFVTLQIFDVLGRQVRTLVERKISAGSHSFKWDGKNSFGVDVAAGLYFANLKVTNNVKTIKLLLVR